MSGVHISSSKPPKKKTKGSGGIITAKVEDTMLLISFKYLNNSGHIRNLSAGPQPLHYIWGKMGNLICPIYV